MAAAACKSQVAPRPLEEEREEGGGLVFRLSEPLWSHYVPWAASYNSQQTCQHGQLEEKLTLD